MPADFSQWLTKAQVAERLQVSTKTVETWAKEGQLEQAAWKRPEGGMPLAVYCPEDVDRIAAERHGGPATGFLVPATTGNGNGHGTIARREAQRPSEDGRAALALGLSEFAAALRLLASESSQSSESASESARLFLTIQEASAVSGLSPTYLRRSIKAGTLKAVRDRGWKIRRTDLEEL